MSNPMAVLVLAQLKHLESKKKNAEEKYDIKITLIRMLYRKGYSKKQILELFKFIDWLILLPQNLENRLTDEIIKLEKEQKMTYVTHMERIAEKKGEKKVAENMLKNGCSIKDIMKYTDLSEKEIIAIRDKLK